MTDEGTAIRTDAEIAIRGASICLTFSWNFTQNQFGISMRESCNTGALPPVVNAVISVRALTPAATLIWDVSETAGAWRLVNVAAAPATPYLTHWAAALSRISAARVTMPSADPLGFDLRSYNPLPYLIGRWSTALIAGSSPSMDELDVSLREWMAEVEMTNPTTATGTLFRYECTQSTQPPTPASCHLP